VRLTILAHKNYYSESFPNNRFVRPQTDPDCDSSSSGLSSTTCR